MKNILSKLTGSFAAAVNDNPQGAAFDRRVQDSGRPVIAALKDAKARTDAFIDALPFTERWGAAAPFYMRLREEPVKRDRTSGLPEKTFTLTQCRTGESLQVKFRGDDTIALARGSETAYGGMHGPAVVFHFEAAKVLYDGPADNEAAQTRIDNFMQTTLGAAAYALLKQPVMALRQNRAGPS